MNIHISKILCATIVASVLWCGASNLLTEVGIQSLSILRLNEKTTRWTVVGKFGTDPLPPSNLPTYRAEGRAGR